MKSDTVHDHTSDPLFLFVPTTEAYCTVKLVSLASLVYMYISHTWSSVDVIKGSLSNSQVSKALLPSTVS